MLRKVIGNDTFHIFLFSIIFKHTYPEVILNQHILSSPSLNQWKFPYVVVLAHIRYQLLLVTSTKNKYKKYSSDNLDHDIDRRKLKPWIQFCRVYIGLYHHHCCVKAWNHIGIIGKAPQMWQNRVIEFKQPLQSGQRKSPHSSSFGAQKYFLTPWHSSVSW